MSNPWSFRAKTIKSFIGIGCQKCGTDKTRLHNLIKSSEFIEKSASKHNNFYDYSKVIYTGVKNKVIIICPIHGEFEQKADLHLRGSGCGECSFLRRCEIRRFSVQEFIEKSNKKHFNFYDYSKVEYINSRTKVRIICLIHGEFLQLPSHHLRGVGCPICSTSKGEIKILNYLKKQDISFIHEHSFLDCISTKGYELRFDFYLPEFNLCIEYDGIQHFTPIEYFGGYISFYEQQKYDKIKTDYCKVNKIELLRIPYTKFDNIESIIANYLEPDIDVNDLF